MNLSPGNFLGEDVIFRSCTADRQTDGQTDRQTDGRTDRQPKVRETFSNSNYVVIWHTSLGDVVRLLNLNEGSPVVGSETGQDPQRRNKIKDNLST